MTAVAPRKVATNRRTRKARFGDVDLRSGGGVPLDGEGGSRHRLRAEVAVGGRARSLGWSRPADRVAAVSGISTSSWFCQLSSRPEYLSNRPSRGAKALAGIPLRHHRPRASGDAATRPAASAASSRSSYHLSTNGSGGLGDRQQKSPVSGAFPCGRCVARTRDLLLVRQVLSQLS
jgi:hypothetical protein